MTTIPIHFQEERMISLKLQSPGQPAILLSLKAGASPSSEQSVGVGSNQNQRMDYTSVTQLFARWGIFYKDGLNWRLTSRLTGEIQGLPGSRGVLVATNGVLCLIDTGANWLFEGHFRFFVPDIDIEDEEDFFPTKKNKKTTPLVAAYAAGTL